MSLDEAYWTEAIKKPDWYVEFVDFFKRAEANFPPDSEELGRFRYRCRTFFENALEAGQVALATDGPDMDDQRLPLDTIVIHHTSNQPGYRLSYLNAVHLLNIYAPYFVNPTDEREKSLKGRGLWSGHFHEGRPVFWGYHWFMRMDGNFTRLLDDDKVGWHAGNWGINRRSVAICLDNDFDQSDPSGEVLAKLAAFIKQTYPDIQANNIIGHCEARTGTTCPGKNFVGGWKKELLKLLV